MPENLTIALMSSLELLDQPFLLLGVDPTATKDQIEDAVESARRRKSASEEILTTTREILLDPARRLPYELAYPLGCPVSELEEWRRLVSAGVQSDELLKHAAQLSPLSQANFFAYAAAHRAAEAELLCAMMDAYGWIEPTNLYDQLKNSRRLGGYPPPSLTHVSEALENQLDVHCQRAISAYGQIEEAADAMFGCVQQLLATGEPRQIDVLRSLLAAYRNATLDERSARAADIEAACDKIEKTPEQQDLTNALAIALDRWISLCRPLLLHETRARAREEALQSPVQRLRSLVIDLTLNARYERAFELAALGKEKLSLIPAYTRLLDEALVPAEQAYRTRRARKLASLTSSLDEHRQNPTLLIGALKQNGFGPGGTGAAERLWQAFVAAVSTTQEGVFVEPWTEIRTFAKWLRGRRQGVKAARSILQGLLDHGPQITAPPGTMEALRDDMVQITASAAKKSVRATPSSAKIRFYLAGTSIVLCAVLILFGFEKPRLMMIESFARSFSPKPATLTVEAGDEETAPAVGTQQHLTLSNLRYCEFQKQRLRLITPKVKTAEDTRAFNLLVVDYNSRCSDILFRDGDAAIVQAELAQNRERLSAEAEQIVSTWRGAAAQNQPTK
jgi:hypothetical protein